MAVYRRNDMYKIDFGVWKTGSGWQPHDIKSKTVRTYKEAKKIKEDTEFIGDMLGDVVGTITKTITKE